MEEGENDLDFIMKPCQIFPPQEEILRRLPFVRPMVNAPDGEESPESPAGIPVASVGITMLTLSQETTMTQDSWKDSGLHDDVFHTPPEQPSLPTSQLSEYAEAADSMDLSDDGELGFAQVKVKKQSSGDSPLKEVKNSEQDLGFDSSQNVVIGKEMPIITESELEHDIEERVEIDESLEGICEAEKLPCSEENEIAEICEEGKKTEESSDKQPENHELPSSIDECLENKAKENENGKCGRLFVFDVLKDLVKNISEDDSPDSIHVNFLELAKARGVNFPRQRWRRQNDDVTRTED